MEQLPPSGQADDYSELSLEEQLSRAEMKLAILYNQFRLIAGNIDEDPYFYNNLNVRSAEIADQHKICSELRLQLLRLSVAPAVGKEEQ